MNAYQSFIFKEYRFDTANKTLFLTYSFDDQLEFCETFIFDFPFVEYDPGQLDRALQNLFFMAGVSYFKAYLPPQLRIEAGQLTQADAEFFNRTYQRGLGEFFYVNQLAPDTNIDFPVGVASSPAQHAHVTEGLLIGLGGGKDSLVSIELLRNQSQSRVATWSLGHQELLQPLIDRIGLPHYAVYREWDRTLLAHNEQGALNGHVPISAILACVGTIVGILAGYDSTVVSNENSANEPTLHYQGVDINHQYSKSLAFEQDYQALLQRNFGDNLKYFSFLRPLSELHIAKLFAAAGFDAYYDVFSSCNRAFVHTSHKLFWCGSCPKCAFVFLALTPFVPREKLEALWGGKNLLLDPELDPMYRRLLGTEGDKPLECVGEVKECRSAMRLATEVYPELQKYYFDVPNDYDYRALAPHSMPERLYDILAEQL